MTLGQARSLSPRSSRCCCGLLPAADRSSPRGPRSSVPLRLFGRRHLASVSSAPPPIVERILPAQASILAVSLCALVLAALFAERRQHAGALAEKEARLQSALRAGGVTAFDWLVCT